MKDNKELLWRDKKLSIHPLIKVVGQVYISDFDKLEEAKGQRSLSENNIDGLGTSIKKYGICTTPIVMRCPKRKNIYIVVDGGHRVHVAKKYDLHIICTLVEADCSTNELMIILNTTQFNWDSKAYLNNGIVFHKNPDYVFLRDIHEKTKISITALYYIYNFNCSVDSAKRLFNSGEWRAETKSLGDRIVKYALQLEEYIPWAKNCRFLQGFANAVHKKGYRQKHMIDKCRNFPKLIKNASNPTQHEAMINQLYNHRTPEDKQVVLTGKK